MVPCSFLIHPWFCRHVFLYYGLSCICFVAGNNLGYFVTLVDTGITIGECVSCWTVGTGVVSVASCLNTCARWIYALVVGYPYVSEGMLFFGARKMSTKYVAAFRR